MYKPYLLLIPLFILVALSIRPDVVKNLSPISKISFTPTSTATPVPQVLPRVHELVLPTFVSQTFNNCGPATLSMMMSFYNKPVSQDILGREMRPYQNPGGNNDDKSIFANEFVSYSEKHGLSSIHRPNGSTELLKKLVYNGFPVVVRTWLHPNEDIGHFRIVRGYDETQQVFIQDDSYEGPNLRYSYEEFQKMWKPFNYSYIVVYPAEKQELLNSILGEEVDEQKAWENARQRAEAAITANPVDGYELFNLAVSNYYLGDYQKSVQYFEQSQPYLPGRMLWYQIEPLESYANLNQSEKVFSLTQNILSNNNAGFSELYFLRGKMYYNQGQTDLATTEFNKAILYNENFRPVVTNYLN